MYYPKGVISSMATCFHEDGALDLAGLGMNVEFQKQAGIKTICVLGGTGEAASMTREERHAVMEETMRHADGLNVISVSYTHLDVYKRQSFQTAS